MTRHGPEPSSSWTRHGWLWAALLAVLAFCPSLRYPYLVDDIPQVENNPRLVTPIHWSQVVWSPHWPAQFPRQPLWRPGLELSLALNRLATGMRPFGFHIVNLLLHGLVVALVWAFVRSLGGSQTTATFTSLLYALHPVHTEAVVSIVGRAEMQMSVFVLLTCIVGLRAIREGRLWFLLLTGAAYALAFFNKEQGFLAPAFLFVSAIACLYLPIPSRRAPEGAADAARDGAGNAARPPVAHLVWTFLLLGAIGIAGVSLRFRMFGLDQSFNRGNVSVLINPLVDVTNPWVRAVTGLRMFGKGLALTLFPLGLSPDYSTPAVVPGAGPLWKTILSGTCLVFLFALAIYLLLYANKRIRNGEPIAAQSRPILAGLGILFYLGFYLPVTNLLTLNGTIFGERLLYLPTVGACLAGAVGMEAAWQGFRRRVNVAIEPRFLRWVGVACVVIGMSWCWKSVSPWRSAEALYKHAIHEVPRSAHAHYGLAGAYYDEGNWEGAIREARVAIGLWPKYGTAWHVIGIASLELKEYKKAEDALRNAIRLSPGLAASYNSLGNALALQGKPKEALRFFRRYQQMGPKDPKALQRKIQYTLEQIRRTPAPSSALPAAPGSSSPVAGGS